LPSGNAKIFVSCIGFQSVDTLVNIAFDQVLLIRKHSPATGSGHQTKVNTLNNSLEKRLKGND
jgi:hypothetical protein